MKNYVQVLGILVLVSLIANKQNNAQSNSIVNDFLSQNLIFSVDGGITYGFSDYKNSSPGPIVKASLEYYPVIVQNARLGLKVFGGGLTLKFNDLRTLVFSDDGPREIPADISTDAIQIGAGVSFGYALGNHVLPTLTLGGTYLNFSPKDSDGKVRPFNKQGLYKKDIFVFTLEGELKVRISERFSLNASLTYYPTSTDYLEDLAAPSNNDSYLAGMVGLSFAFAGSFDADEDGISDKNDLCPGTPIGVKVDQFGCPLDSDTDGIPDYIDECPNTPYGIKVDSNGCPLDNDKDGVPDYLDKCPDTPANLVVDSIGCPEDSDKDGVADYLDKCNNTPVGVEVDKFGCPIDSDKDGVPDYQDKCPDTPVNTKVDLNGCSENDVDKETFYQFNLRGDDTFDNGSSNLKIGAKLILNEIAFYIQNQVGSKWRIEGHMDSQGAVYSIKKLSYERAKAVYDYLLVQGVSADQLEIYGLGDSYPIGNNNTLEGRSANRRIMIIKED
jgi:outer membrane protein OmpA-like peptidoglycan-associated protein